MPADRPHSELVERVNGIKVSEGAAEGGRFSINEHKQVIAKMQAPPGYKANAIHVVDVADNQVFTYEKHICFQGGMLDPRSRPNEGDPWPGPLCGTSYTFSAPENKKPPSYNLDEIWVEVDGKNQQLSSQIGLRSYPPSGGRLADFLGALRRQLPSGGRFRVNEYGRAFTAKSNIYIGTIPRQYWFRPIPLIDTQL